MRSLFSDELQRYYTRKGNRLLFANKMTLNQLALEMWEKLGCKEIDASVLSRVLAGERLFTFKQLEIFGQTLHLKKINKERLKLILLNEYNLRFGLNEDYLNKSDTFFISIIEENLKRIRELKTRDVVVNVDEWINQITEELDKKIYLSFNSAKRNFLLKLYADFLVENNYFIQVSKSKKESFKPIIDCSAKLEKIGKEINNPIYLSLAQVHIGDICYINGLYKDSIRYIQNGLKDFNDQAQNHMLSTPFRTLALPYAHLGMKEEFEEATKNILKKMSNLTIEGRCLALEGIAKGMAILGKAKDSEMYFLKDNDVFEKLKQKGGHYEHLMKAVIVTGELEAAWNLRSKKRQDKNYLEKIGKEGTNVARKYGYKRYERKINFLLNKLLN